MSDAAFSLYMLRCADGTLYTGIAIDVERRLGEHGRGVRGAKYLRGRRPFELVYRARAGCRADAQRLEHLVKRLPRRDKLRLVDGSLTLAAVGAISDFADSGEGGQASESAVAVSSLGPGSSVPTA